ncbi:hypothetical protein ACLX1H_011239 [Fusarium chlamydosporum]
MDVNAMNYSKPTYDVHTWTDKYGNQGTEILSQRHITLGTVRVHGLFGISQKRPGIGLADYFNRKGLLRRIFVVLDAHLPDAKRGQVVNHFEWCKTEKLLDDYTVMPLAVHQNDKTLDIVESVVAAAQQYGLKRRDLFVAVGGTTVTDIAGFAAAIYRRSTPWILVPTDPIGFVRGSAYGNRLSVHHISHGGVTHKGALALIHPPIAKFYDPGSLSDRDVRRALAEIIRISVTMDADLFSYVEAHMERILATSEEREYLGIAIELAIKADAAAQDPDYSPHGLSGHISLFQAAFWDEATRSIGKVRAIAPEDDADSVAIAVGLMSAVSASKGSLSNTHLDRILKLIKRSGLALYDGLLEADTLWEDLNSAVRQLGATAFIVPATLGKGACLEVANISPMNISAALSVLRRHFLDSETGAESPARDTKITSAAENVIGIGDGIREQAISEDVRYHVATAPGIFDKGNMTLIQSYCAADVAGVSTAAVARKKKILVVVDDYLDSTTAAVVGYFKHHRSIIDGLGALPMRVSSAEKDMRAVLKVVHAAAELSMSQSDLIIAVGGGTLMDVVGFAAAMYNGGIPYLRIPTTLVGMIDAGVGVKVGVNLGSHKSLVGRYYAPIACLNDPETFLATLPQREFACGLAEAIKMAVLKSPRLFEVIQRHHSHVGYNPYTDELIHTSIHTMLEELQPNLHEESLRRLVDFGHEFGHIVEALARYEVPHGECVAVGMAISSFLAHLKGILSRAELERILNCVLDLGLPIHLEDYLCCDPSVLWAKISTAGIEHKDGMLYLVVPEAIGRGTFLEDISEIDASMLKETVTSLKEYSNRHAGVSCADLKKVLASEIGSPYLSGSINNSSLWTLSDNSGSRGSPVLSDMAQSVAVDNKPRLAGEQSPTGSEAAASMVAAVIGASGDLGSQLVSYLVKNGVRVICSVRLASLHKLEKRIGSSNFATVRILVGEVLDSANLRIMIQEANVLYNMAGVVTLGSKPAEFPKVIALNGFVQGFITHLIESMGRAQDVKVVYPSTQRVHLINDNRQMDAWIQDAAAAYSAQADALAAGKDVYMAVERFSEQFVVGHPLPTGFNAYEVSKRLGECFVSWLPRHSLVRISSVYGPTFTRGFIHRAVYPKKAKGNMEAREKRDFIYVDDLNELLLKAAQIQTADGNVFDAASDAGSIYLQEVWEMVRKLVGDGATAIFGSSGVAQEEMNPDPTFARQMLGREFTPLRLGLYKTIEQSVQVRKGNGKACPWSWNGTGIIVVDVGATYMRVGAFTGPHGLLFDNTRRAASPSRQAYPRDTLPMLQEKLLETLVMEITAVRANHSDHPLEEVGIALGAVVTRDGVVEDASILWGEPARGYDLKGTLQERLPGMRLTILNDVSAAAWRYRNEGRFCLITVSSGLSNKVFNADLHNLDKLDLDSAGVGGEMGHVVVEPRAVEALVNQAISRATTHPKEFKCSRLNHYVSGNVRKINARHLGISAKEGDCFAQRLLEEADVPYCACGNLADLCSYSSGRAALRRARTLAVRGDYGVELASENLTDDWLRQAIAVGHPLALKVLHDSTYPLALRILQLAADIGLDKFIIVGGFALRIRGGAYLRSLQDHLVRLCPYSGFFSGWEEDQVRGIVRLGVDDDDDGLIGMGHFVQHLRAQYRAVEKPVGEQTLSVTTREIPRCGAREVVAKVVYSGICTTDLQILRGERELEPIVLGHEGVCQVLKVGKNVKGLSVGEIIVLNPNNPLDDHDKLGHTREGVFQQYVKFGQEFLDREQVLTLGSDTISATDTLIEPLSCVVAAQGRIQDRIPGKNVLVVGAGVMGLLFALTNTKMGARNVYLANRSRQRLDFATARGIVEEGKAFVISGCPASASSQVDKASASEGVDVVIICVSLGQGVQAAQNAVGYVNPGGCIYLFAGFRPGDVLTLAGGDVRLDAWSVRSGWKTERIHVAGKNVDISGHRGSRKEDLVTAANLIRGDNMAFSRVISHVVSLDALPESMLSLAQDGSIRGAPAQRVVVDMDAQHGVVERTEELPLRYLREAARKPKSAIPRSNLFRNIGFAGSTSLLGWACPPAWREIQVALGTALNSSPLNSKPRHVIWVGTGGWVSLVDALKEIVPADPAITFHTLQSLDPQDLGELFLRIDDMSTTVCLGISQSGETLETTMLMNAMRERFDNAGLDYHQHFAWLTDMCGVITGSRSGEEAIRSSTVHDWKHVYMIPTTVNSSSDINALFCAPHSMLMFLALSLLLRRDLETMQHIYQQYLGFRDGTVVDAVRKAYSIALTNTEHIQVNVDKSIASSRGLARLSLQVIEQALGAKQAGFNPRARVGSGNESPADGFELLTLRMPTESSAVVKAMLTMDALSAFVAMMAYHRKIVFVTHPKVDIYKHRAAELMDAAETEAEVSDLKSIRVAVVEYLRDNPRTRFIEILDYGRAAVSHGQRLADWIASHLTSTSQNVSIDVAQGEEWNHSRYQAAVQREDTV